MESFGSDHLPKLDFFSDFRALCSTLILIIHENFRINVALLFALFYYARNIKIDRLFDKTMLMLYIFFHTTCWRPNFVAGMYEIYM